MGIQIEKGSIETGKWRIGRIENRGNDNATRSFYRHVPGKTQLAYVTDSQFI